MISEVSDTGRLFQNIRIRGMHMKTLQGVILLSIAVFAAAGSASRLFSEERPSKTQMDERLARHVTVADLVSYAYMSNPSILAAKEAWKATVEKYRLEAGYPDPQFTATYFPEPIETRLGPQDWNLNLSQAIPFPGKLSKAGASHLTLSHVLVLGANSETDQTKLSIEFGCYVNRRVKVELICLDRDETRMVELIRKAANTGQPGDGIITVTNVNRLVKIRTAAESVEAL